MYTVLLVIHTIIVLFLIVIVLIQRSSSDGMAGLGGGGGNQFLTGSSAANILTRVTAILAALFMLTSITLAVMAGRMTHGGSIIDQHVEETQAPTVPVEAKKEAPAATQTPVVPKPE